MLAISVPLGGKFHLVLPDGREVVTRLYRVPSRDSDTLIRVVVDAPADVRVHRGQRRSVKPKRQEPRPPATLLPLPAPKAKRPTGPGGLAGRVRKTSNP